MKNMGMIFLDMIELSEEDVLMEGSNLLEGGIEQLNEMKECLLELGGYRSNNETLIHEEEALENRIGSTQKDLEDEIEGTTKKRRQEIEDAFDKQLDKLHTRSKRIRDKRERSKSHKVSQRIKEETSDTRSENAQLKQETKTLFKQKHVPGFCNTKLYYALFAPKCLSDYMIILGALILTLFLVPCGIYFFLLPEEKIIYLILTYVLSVLFFGGIYVLIANCTKVKFPDEIRKVKGIRTQIRANKKKIAIIKKNIRKDRDESTYGLQEFDAELAKLEQETAEIVSQKKEALLTFDQSTRHIIASEIEGSYKEKLEGLKAELTKASAAVKQAEERIKALTLKVASDYEPFLGKDMMNQNVLDALINILQEGNAANISEAIAFYHKNHEASTDTPD
jgi:hypothetical protein